MKNLKMNFLKSTVLMLIFLFTLLLASVAQAAPKVTLNGNQLSFDVSPTIENGRTLVPLRTIFEALGANIDWDDATNTVTANKADINVRLQIGAQTAYKNGGPVNLDVPAKIISDRTMVPLRFVSEALGADVNWDANTQTIAIVSNGIVVSQKNDIVPIVQPTNKPSQLPVVQPVPLTTPQPQPTVVEPEVIPVTTGQYVGSTESNKYHYPSCRYAQKIKSENEIWFKNAADAQAHGYIPCGVCKP